MRQYTHDVRNTINCMDLEMELMQDLVTDPEAVTSMNRIREQLRSMELQMRSLSAAFHEPRPTPDRINARVLMQIWREKQAELAGTAQTLWHDHLEAEEVEVDVEMMAQVFNELLANANTHSPAGAVTVSAEVRDGQVCFELREPKKEPVNPELWATPFSAASRGHYGLGLWGVRNKVESNQARFQQFYDEKAGCLVTEIKLPAYHPTAGSNNRAGE